MLVTVNSTAPMLRWLYPDTCELCGELSQSTLCPSCRDSLPPVPRPICLYCGSPTGGEQTDPYYCRACKNLPRNFDFARSALCRTETTMELIYSFKYHKKNHLGHAFAPLLAKLWLNTPALQEHRDWVLVPVPITHQRLSERGYNQAEELALPLARQMDLPILHPLQRIPTEHSSQTLLSAQARLKNAAKAYKLLPAYQQRTLPPHLLIVDDVYTTGATVRACAKILKSCPGVQTVGVITLIRAT